MKKNFFLTLMLALVALFSIETATAQAPVATPQEAITGLLNRIGGNGAADRFEIVIDANLAQDGKDVFIIAPGNGKPCIKGNTQLSVATGINWYLNHYAHINLTWNNLTTDLSAVKLPVPTQEEKHVCNTTYRYDFNTCTFSYSMAFWTWERWQQEIDWMALHGINAPLNLVGLDVLWRNILKDKRIGYSDAEIAEYVAGPGFIAWFAMNNLEGWGGTINSPQTGVEMHGNPDWWYTRQEQLCRDMLQRMRELGMQPVIPGFSGQVPNSMAGKTISGINASHIINNGSWEGYTRPDIINPATDSYDYMAGIYYEHLEALMGVSEFYSIDPFHEGNSLPSPATNEGTYPGIMESLDAYYDNVEKNVKDSYNAPEKTKWIIQKWQSLPQKGAFTAMKERGYGDRFIGLDLFADAPGKAEWDNDFFSGCDFIFCMLHNFGGRSGLHGRLETVMTNYFRALEKNDCMGIGATPEGIETNPILYDLLFELPWMTPGNHLTADEWVKNYSYSRYGIQSETAENALLNLKESVWNCPSDQQGTTEAVILARPAWTVDRVSTWVSATVYWDTQDVLLAADQLYSVKDLVTENGGEDGIANYNYDFIDVVRQAMVDYAAQLLPLIKVAYDSKNTDEYTRLYTLYLQLMLDLDTMLSYDENFKLERWTSLARNIADEVDGTTENDRNWLEWNARTQVTVWSNKDNGLHDYSNRCWAGLIKDFHYKRWEKFFTTNGGSFNGGWREGFEYPWTVDFNEYYNFAGDYSKVVIPADMTATEKAAETFGNYFGRVKGAKKNYVFPMGVTTSATASDVIPEVYRDKTVELPLEIGKSVTISSVWIDLNNDGAASGSENLAVTEGNKVAIPANAAIGKTTAKVTYSDGTVITFNLALIEDITKNRTVTAVAGANGSVAIEGADGTTVTNALAVKMIATANTGYNFENWTDAQGEVVSNDNPFIYYGKEEATFTANFIQDRWGVVICAPDKDNEGNDKDEAAVLNDISNNKQYIPDLKLAYYNREAEVIFEASSAPTSIFTTIPQIINVPRGASFTVTYNNGDSDNFKHCYFRAYIDLNGDGDFDDEGELLKEVGSKGAQNTAVCSNAINVLLPYDMPLGITHMRLRFDSAWNIGDGAKSPSVRPVYEIIINVTDFSDKAAHITVATNSEEWGTVKVWTDETPDGSTSTEWDVTKGVPFFIAAEKTSEDVEFLGWYDQYGRLVTENLEHTMYAREDATYTARFRKFLEIDGWQIEYRTQPGKDVVTTKLANGVKPEAGKKYYIYAPTRPTNDGEYVNRYLYNNGGSLGLGTVVGDASYIWLCEVNGENYTFQNVGDPTKYLAHKGLLTWGYDFKLGTGDTKYEGITIYSVYDKKYLVTKDDGTGFDQSDGTHNQSSENYTTDYVFVEVSTPDVIVFTKVRQSGNRDLVIPQTVEVLGEQLTVVGFDKNLFNNNTDLWSITLPSTMEFLGSNVIFETSLQGINTPTSTGDSNIDGIKQVIDLGGITLSNNEYWKVVAEYESDGVSTYNEWGTPLLEVGDHTSGSEVELFYLSSKNYWSSCWHVRAPFLNVNNANYNDLFKNHTDGKFSKFTAVFENLGDGTARVTVVNSEGESMKSHTSKFTTDGITTFTASLPKGVNIVNFTITKDEKVNPFSGCRNLDNIAIDGNCKNYYVANDGGLYNSSDELVCMPEGKEKGADSRALAALIEQMEELTAQVGTYNPAGKANKITLQTTNANVVNYLWTNNADTSEGSVHHLVDGIKGKDDNFFHSNWHSVSTAEGYHYIEVDLGADNMYTMMQFAYHTRTNCSNDFPDAITVMGSNDKQNYTEIHTESSNLPQVTNKEFKSAVFDCGQPYRYLRFKVTAERTYWHMGEFELFFMTSTADVYSYLEAGITNEQAAAGYDAMLDAQAVYDYGTTAKEMQDAKTALQSAYDTLKALLDAAIPVKLTTDEANPVLYKIFIKRTADVTVLKYDEPSGMVAVENKADDSSWQAWYFMSGTNGGVTIHPYNGDGKVLSADNTGNSPAKVWAVEKGEKAFYEWKFVTRADGYHNIQVYDGSNYFSNNGGTGNKMGFWSGSPESDTGSLFKFVEAEFTNDNARFYQMCDIKATMTDGTNIYGGTSVGLYTGGKEYREAYTAAAALQTTGNTSASDECYAAYKALRAANEVLAYNAADPGKVYYIVSAATNAYCKGQYVHTYAEVQPSHNNYDHKDLVYHNFNNIAIKTLAAFQFETTATQGEYKMKNLHTGLYVKSFGKNADHLGAAAEAQVVKIAGIADGQVTLKIGDADPMHAQDDNDCIVGWGASVGNASTWTIDEVTDLVQLNYYFTVPQDGVATLNLAFNAVLPSGVTVYDIAVDDITLNGTHYEYEATAIATAGEVLAKNTPVVVKANPGTYVFGVTLTDDGAKGSVTASVLKGTTYKTTLAADANNYQLAVSDDQVVFNLVTAAAATAANSAWMQLAENRGAVIYDNAPVEPEVELVLPEVGKVYRMKSYVSNVVAEYQNHYLVNGTTGLTLASAAATDNTDLWVCTSKNEAEFTFVSALGTAALGWQAVAEDAVAYTLSAGVASGALTLTNGDNNLAVNIDAAGNTTFTQSGAKTQSVGWSTDWYLEEVEDAAVSYTTTIANGNKWATMYLPFAVKVPSGVEVYVATGIDGKTVNLAQVNTNIPKNTAVLLYRADDTNTDRLELAFNLADEDVAAVGSNLFEGKIRTTAIPVAGARVYLLVKYNGNEKFYWMQDEYNANCAFAGAGSGYVKCDANKCYLRIVNNASPASSFSFRFEGTTGVEEVKVENGKVKAIYDLQGRKLTEITKPGFYIVDGEKVFVK